ncbi:ABC transporter ATP-binding protein [Nocardia sp. NPDC057668]|uniref:ABC transporter ATP-binding protein n=1 Tax=Nocardia sp. NPDC057668 TaxID=3346202 RepID=UPI0036702229
MIECDALTKNYGATVAVSELSCTIEPGRVTGFLGPNGSGKSTTMRMILGLDLPGRGTVLIGGRPYRTLREPLRTVGALLDARRVHPDRRARDHLTMLALSNAIPSARVAEVLAVVGLGSVARQRVRGFSLGMLQRLGIAAAILGDPAVLLLDEPTNGLDTEGIRWLRGFLRGQAGQGRTVLLSSHVMSEMELVADHLLVIGGGRLLADEPMPAFIARSTAGAIRVRSDDNAALARAFARAGIGADRIEPDAEHRLVIRDVPAARVGAIAAEAGVIVSELTEQRASLEDVYTDLVTPHGRHRHRVAGEVA